MEQLSKIVSHALRHEPSLYNIELDKNGWADIFSLIEGIRSVSDDYNNLTMELIIRMVNSSRKKRHEIKDCKIRAFYGHSLEKRIKKTPSIPPKYLYHGTSKKNLKKIVVEGLLPMGRQYVHLSEKRQEAYTVALRKTEKPILLKISSIQSYDAGNVFYKELNNLWLSDKISSDFLEIESNIE